MKCEEGNKIDLVEYLFSLGFTPTKIRGNNYWYLSPLRNEKEASFKIHRNKNVWYDHGAGKGGTVVDFVMQYSTAIYQEHYKNYHPMRKHYRSDLFQLKRQALSSSQK